MQPSRRRQMAGNRSGGRSGPLPPIQVNRQHDHKQTRQRRAGLALGNGIQAGLPEQNG